MARVILVFTMAVYSVKPLIRDLRTEIVFTPFRSHFYFGCFKKVYVSGSGKRDLTAQKLKLRYRLQK